MKNLLLVFTLLIAAGVHAQNKEENKMLMIGDRAPKFTTQSTTGEITFPDNYFGKWKVLLSHPADFTPVCSSEILELAYLQNDFKELNTQIAVISTDGLNSHLQWKQSLESIEYKGRKPVQIDFPLIPDVGLEISKQYGMIHSNSGSTKDVRGVFIIDDNNKIRATFFYPQSIGRNMEEIKRTIAALQMADKSDKLTPANWEPGDDVMIKAPLSIADTAKLSKKYASKNLYSYNWYMWMERRE